MVYVNESIWFFKYLGEPNFIREQLYVFDECKIDDLYMYMYMYKVKVILSIFMACIDAYSELKNHNIFDIYLEKYEGNEISNIIQYIHSFINNINNNIPTEKEFINLKGCIHVISCFYDMY
ncbi:hypothetical protein DWC20_11115 [Clostridium botulinum]|uniref:hypothetical protein n=1 Tax=Clostridium botulinum TaxID=1491 RepID=UPI00036293F0|nr:hypothetical protein [Clostridium botulinum]MBN1036095.1 hypothetical protein [Clostridium botulinum]